MKRALFVLLVALLMVAGAVAQTDDVLSVDASAPMGPISPYVYGSNMNLYALVPMSLMDEAQAMGLRLMRFGGGDTDRMDLRTNIIDLFVMQSRLMGAEPLLSVRLLGGTPEAAAEFVRYANIEKQYGIRYWSIGNEPNLFAALMGVERYTTEDLNREWRVIAEAMLAVDPTIQLVGPDITQVMPLSVQDDRITYLPPARGGWALDSDGRDWLVEFLRANGDLLAYVALHRYPFPGEGGAAAPDTLPATSAEWDVVIPNLRQIIRETAGRDIPIAITEVNSNSANSVGGPASLDSLANAIWLGDVLGRMIRNRVEAVAYWDVQGGSNRGWGLIGSFNVRPAAYTYMLYTHFGTTLVPTQFADGLVTMYGALREDGALTLMVVNQGQDAATRTLAIAGFAPGGEAEVWRVDAEAQAEQVGSAALADGAQITVPAQSLTLYVLPPA